MHGSVAGISCGKVWPECDFIYVPFSYEIYSPRTLTFLHFLPEPIFGLTLLSYLVFRNSAKLIETLAVPFTVFSVKFVSLKSQNKKKILYFISFYLSDSIPLFVF